jgi:hypothetical protein
VRIFDQMWLQRRHLSVLCSLQRTYTFSMIHQPELLMSFVSQEQCSNPIRPHISQMTGRNEMPKSVSAAWGARIDSLVQVQPKRTKENFGDLVLLPVDCKKGFL